MKTHIKSPNRAGLKDEGLPYVLQANEILNRKQIIADQYNDLLKIKRERSEWEKTHRTLFFMIGLTVSLVLIILAFNWKTYESQLVDLGQVEGDFDEIMEIPLSEQPPPPPPQQKTEVFNIKEVDDAEIIEDIEIQLDVEMNEDQNVADVVYDMPVIEMPEEEAEEIFQIVEDWPEPIGGMSAFYAYVGDNLDYPEMAKRLDVSGVVYVQFVVEKDGGITDVKVIKGIGAGCDEEAVRVIQDSPKWKPGKQRGNPVRVYRTVPIRFILKQR